METVYRILSIPNGSSEGGFSRISLAPDHPACRSLPPSPLAVATGPLVTQTSAPLHPDSRLHNTPDQIIPYLLPSACPAAVNNPREAGPRVTSTP
ncbi:unnamed protein product [Lota lota]